MIELKIKGHRTRCLLHHRRSLQLCGVREAKTCINPNRMAEKKRLKNARDSLRKKSMKIIFADAKKS